MFGLLLSVLRFHDNQIIRFNRTHYIEIRYSYKGHSNFIPLKSQSPILMTSIPDYTKLPYNDFETHGGFNERSWTTAKISSEGMHIVSGKEGPLRCGTTTM
jgi:hypothetical protein